MTAARSDFDLVQTRRGPDLLLLHSLVTDRTVFDPIVPRLARAPGHRAQPARVRRLEAAGPRPSRPLAAPSPPSTSGPRSRPSPTPRWSWWAPSTSPPRPRLARELAAGIRGAALVEIPECAHCPPIEKPAELLAALEPFLDAPVPR